MSSMVERFRLDGRVALVTGASSGIGRGFSHALGEMGAKVAIVDINLDGAEAVVQELKAKNIEAMATGTDVCNEKQIRSMLDSIAGRWGAIDIAVNNAGMGMWIDSTEMSYEDWRKVLRLNLDAVFLCCREEVRIMKEKGYGKIINTASMSARIANTPQNQSAYNASKAGVLHLTRSLAVEFAPFGIRVNSISPGYTRTPMVENMLNTEEGKDMLPRWLERTPMGRMATPEDLQGAVCFLASGVSDYMTGSDMIIDGGYCCW